MWWPHEFLICGDLVSSGCHSRDEEAVWALVVIARNSLELSGVKSISTRSLISTGGGGGASITCILWAVCRFLSMPEDYTLCGHACSLQFGVGVGSAPPKQQHKKSVENCLDTYLVFHRNARISLSKH